MASRKAKAREKSRARASSPDVADSAPGSGPASAPASAPGSGPASAPASAPADRPSSSMTVEVEALSVTDLLNVARSSARNLPPAPPTTARSLDDLAATVEVPSLAAVGPRILLMDAAEAVMADRGYHHTTIREVSAFAGVSVDVFHAHFADMRAMLNALVERFSEQAMNTVDDATRPSKWDGADGSLAVEYAVRTIVDLMTSHIALLRALFTSNDRALVDEIRRVGTHLTIRLTRLLNDLPHPPEPIEVGFAVLSALSIAHHAATVGPAWSGVELERDDIAKRAANMAVAYLESTRRSR